MRALTSMMPAQTANQPARWGLAATTALVATQAIGVGIFLTPARMARSLQSPLGVFLVWGLMGMMAWSGAWCFGKLAARYPRSGGSYVYLREIYGRDTAFLFGWMSFWVMDTGVMAALSVGLISYLAYLHPLPVLTVRLLGAALPAAIGLGYLLLPAGTLRALTAVNLLKLLLVGGLPLWIFFSGRGSWNHLRPMWRPVPAPWAGHLGGAVVAAFFALAGWWEATKVAEKIRDPERTLPRALAWGIGCMIAMYALLTAALLYLIPIARLAPGEAFLAQAGMALAGVWGARILTGLVVLCVASMVGSLLLTTPQVYLAMRRDGLFPEGLARMNADGWPARITAVQMLMIALLALTGSFAAIAAFPVFSAVLFLALTAGGVLRLPGQSRGTRGLTWLFLGLSLLVLAPVLTHYRHALGGVAITLLGWPVCRRMRRKERAISPA